MCSELVEQQLFSLEVINLNRWISSGFFYLVKLYDCETVDIITCYENMFTLQKLAFAFGTLESST